jgi:hypothetical protein
LQRSTRARFRRLATALVTIAMVAGGTLGSAGAAQAADLIVLGPDSFTIAGTVQFDHVYIGDGATLRLLGDTAIVANDVYLAGGSSLRTCFVAPASDNGCSAGRNLLIQATGQVNIGSGISLTAGSGAVRPGGSLAISGASVSVEGGIDTSGSMGGGSGSVAISSPGAIALSSAFYQATVNAPGAPVSIHGASVALTGDLTTAGSDASIVTGGGVDVAATSGPLRINGNVNSSGRDASGGSGADVSLRGGDVRVGRIDASAGGSSLGAPGYAGNVGILGNSSISISDSIDTRGASGPTGFGATGGGNVSLSSPGTVIASNIFTAGSNGDSAPPSGAGSIVISGGAVAVGQLLANGGNRAGNPGYGSAAAGVSIRSAGALSVDEVEAFGGNSNGDGYAGGAGGQIVLNGDGIFTSELRTTPGSSTGNSPGGQGGLIVVNGRSAITILGGVFANGANATGGAPWGGGAGANVTLHAIAGPLALSAPIRTNGGNGGNAPSGVKAGAGGPGGSVDLVGSPIDPIAGISTEGGDGGTSNNADNRGVGGNGGSVHAWSETNIFGTLRAISTAGGGGAPPGVDGAELQDSGPTGLAVDATGLLSFSSKSPSAEGYRVIRTLGDAATPILTTRLSSRIALPAVDICTPVSYQVQAFQSAVGWTSPLTAAVPFLRQPSETQRCTDAPTLSRDSKVVIKQSTLTKAKGAFAFTVQTNGLGSVTATASMKGAKKPLAVTVVPLAKVGAFSVALKLDPKAKLRYVQTKKKKKGKKKHPPAVARLSVTLVATAPSGKATTSITVPVEVRK